MLRRSRLSLAISAVSLFFVGQALAQPPIIQPGAPGQSSRQISIEEASALAGTRVTDADITFMQDMIMHHDQAVQMTAMIDGRSQRDERSARQVMPTC